MRDDKYISEMVVGISNAQDRGLLSPSGGKRLTDNIVDNSKADIIAARLIEADWDTQDMFEGKNYYGN